MSHPLSVPVLLLFLTLLPATVQADRPLEMCIDGDPDCPSRELICSVMDTCCAGDGRCDTQCPLSEPDPDCTNATLCLLAVARKDSMLQVILDTKFFDILFKEEDVWRKVNRNITDFEVTFLGNNLVAKNLDHIQPVGMWVVTDLIHPFN